MKKQPTIASLQKDKLILEEANSLLRQELMECKGNLIECNLELGRANTRINQLLETNLNNSRK